MSDSFVVSRAGTKAKRRKPPQRPRGTCPYLLPELLLLAATLFYYAAASRAHNMLLVGLFGLVAVFSVQSLVRWWRWRAWSAWSGEPVERVGRISHLIDWALVVWIWAYIALAFT